MIIKRERALDLADLVGGTAGSTNARQNALGLGGTALHDQKARTFRNEQERNEKEGRRQELDPEHPAPGFKAKKPFVEGRSSRASNQVIAEESHKQAADDGHLLDG